MKVVNATLKKMKSQKTSRPNALFGFITQKQFHSPTIWLSGSWDIALTKVTRLASFFFGAHW